MQIEWHQSRSPHGGSHVFFTMVNLSIWSRYAWVVNVLQQRARAAFISLSRRATFALTSPKKLHGPNLKFQVPEG